MPSVGESGSWAGHVARIETGEMHTGICGGNLKKPLVNQIRKWQYNIKIYENFFIKIQLMHTL